MFFNTCDYQRNPENANVGKVYNGLVSLFLRISFAMSILALQAVGIPCFFASALRSLRVTFFITAYSQMYPRRARFVGLKLEDFVKIDAKIYML